MFKKTVSIASATIWIGLSEFFRNEYLLKSFWTEHYRKLGITYPADPVNGMIWGVWSLLFAISIYILMRNLPFIQAFLFSWFVGFMLMWIVIWNLGVLPAGILIFAVPLSLFETLFACYFMKWTMKSL